ncbi:unnamed protein product, partial [Allacma fusca]
MEPLSMTNTNPPYTRSGLLLEKLQPHNNPVVKLYYPAGNNANGYREEWYSPTANPFSAQLESLSLVRKIEAPRLEMNPVELQQPLNPENM